MNLHANAHAYIPCGGFDKPEVQIPTLPSICPARGVVGHNIDRWINVNSLGDGRLCKNRISLQSNWGITG